MKGLVYLLTNPAMPGIVKIGLTTRGDMKQRPYTYVAHTRTLAEQHNVDMRTLDKALWQWRKINNVRRKMFGSYPVHMYAGIYKKRVWSNIQTRFF